jgi:sec-independent protein translocase protein TatA
MPHIGLPELLIVLVIVVLIFGVGKMSDLGGALGKSIREFREATASKDNEAEKPEKKETKKETKQE